MHRLDRLFLSLLVVGIMAALVSFKFVRPGVSNGFEVFKSTKLILDEQLPFVVKLEREGDWFRSNNEEFFLLSKGAELNLLLKPNCFAPNVSQQDLMKKVNKQSKMDKPFPAGYKSITYVIEEETTSDEFEKLLSKQECVLGASNRRQLFPSSYFSDPLAKGQTHYRDLEVFSDAAKLNQVYQAQQQEVIVAVIDSGLDLSHPDLKEHIWVNLEELKGKAGYDDDANGYDDDIHGFDFSSRDGNPSHKGSSDHGTHVAGLIAATSNNQFGIASFAGPKLKLMILNVTGKYRGAMSEDIEEAVYYAINNGAHIINISMGSPGRADTLAYAINEATKRGIFVTASAGNQGYSLNDNFHLPASYAQFIPGFMSIGAYDISNGQKCSGSNHSQEVVEIFAPGCDQRNPKKGLLSTMKGGSFGYRRGTSMSTPILSSAAAIIYGSRESQSLNQDMAVSVEKYFKENSRASHKILPYAQEGRVFEFDHFFR